MSEHDWLIGWVTYPKAVELFETTWLGPRRKALSPDLAERKTALFVRDIRSRIPSMKIGPSSAPVAPLSSPEKAEMEKLAALERDLARINTERAENASKLLRNYLANVSVASRLIHRITGHSFTLPGRFWASDEAQNAIRGVDCAYPFDRFLARGPVLISEADVRERAKPTIATPAPTATEENDAPSARAPAKRSLGSAYRAAREFVLLPQNDGRKVKQDEVRRHVEGEGHKVAEDDPGEWWKQLKADPETAGRIAGRGRPPKNPSENPPKKSRR